MIMYKKKNGKRLFGNIQKILMKFFNFDKFYTVNIVKIGYLIGVLVTFFNFFNILRLCIIDINVL